MLEQCTLREAATYPYRWSIDWEEMERVVRLGVRFLDDVIEMNPYPLPEIDATVKAIKCLVGVTRGLVAKFSDLSGITTKLTSVTDGLKARMAALKEASGVVGDIMQAVKDAFEDMRARVEDVRDDVVTGGKDKTRPSATDAIKNFAGSVTGPASKLRDRFGEIRAQFKDKLAVAFGGANLDFDGMKNNFGSLGKTFDEVKTQFEACKAGAIPDVASTTEELVEVPRLLRPLLRKKAPPPVPARFPPLSFWPPPFARPRSDFSGFSAALRSLLSRCRLPARPGFALTGTASMSFSRTRKDNCFLPSPSRKNG